MLFFLYIDGVGTIIDNCINIGTDLKLDSVGQVVFLLFTQIVACIGSLVFWKTVTDIQNYNAFVCLHCGIFCSLSICTYTA